MITVGMNYHVIEGKQAEFEGKFAAVLDALRAADGHTHSTLWKDVADNASYLITSEWSDEAAFMSFIQSQAFKDVTTWGKEQILSGAQHKTYKKEGATLVGADCLELLTASLGFGADCEAIYESPSRSEQTV